MSFNELFNKTFATQLTFSQENINTFAEISGDNNPLHIDPEFAAKSKFGKTIVHGMLTYGVISEWLAQNFPKSKQNTQSLSFLSPIFANEEISLVQEVIAVVPAEQVLQVKTTILKSDGTVACQSLSELQIP